MKIISLIIAIISLSIIVFNNIHQIGLTLSQGNSTLITGFILIILITTLYLNHNRKKLSKWM